MTPSKFRTRRLNAAVLSGAVTILVACAAPPSEPPPEYFPPAETSSGASAWDRISPADAGFDNVALQAAVDFAVNAESDFGPDLRAALGARLAGDSLGEILGPMKSRGPASGVILRHGYRVAEWGDPDRVDMTFSVTKSVLSTVAGLAWDRGLMGDVGAPIGESVTAPGLFDGAHNSKITWEMLLQQRSEWEGTLWGKPDVADRREGRDRDLQAPGTLWEYNDVRVNLAALSLLYVWERPLPEVLREFVMGPIGATDEWEWHGYPAARVEIAGDSMTSVSGGGHWGGGLWISADDLARLGYLFLRRGQWAGERVISPEWIDLATAPAEVQPGYGYMWWLNTDRAQYPNAPETAYFAIGGGSNLVWIDPQHDLVAVVRWIDGGEIDEFIGRVLDALTEE